MQYGVPHSRTEAAFGVSAVSFDAKSPRLPKSISPCLASQALGYHWSCYSSAWTFRPPAASSIRLAHRASIWVSCTLSECDWHSIGDAQAADGGSTSRSWISRPGHHRGPNRNIADDEIVA